MKKWINVEYLKDGKKLNEKYAKNNPFPYIVLPDFFNENKIPSIVKALAKEKFILKDSDLFQFKQTNDLVSSTQKLILEFRNFLCSKEFISFMEKISGEKLTTGKIDMAGTLYEDTDYLLCHDDRLDKRKIAFLWYLQYMEEDEGGSLNLFNSKNKLPTSIAKKIIPKFNTFAFFTVSDISFHEVEEVIVNKQRLAIGGWFYGKD